MKKRKGDKGPGGGFASRVKTVTNGLLGYSWWHIATLVVGFLSFVSLLVILFLPLSKGPTRFIYAGAMTKISSSDFVRSISDSLNLPLDQADAVQSLINGNAFMDSFLKDIDEARSSINIMVYIWTDGRMSDRIIERLSKKLSEGVQVRIILDSFGSNWWDRPKAKLNALVQVGAKLEIFRSLTIAPWDFLKNHMRNHRRAMVIDGNIGYFGGMAISDPWLGNADNSKEIHDMMFRATGSMARHLQGVFSELWASTAGEILLGDFFFPPLPAKRSGDLTYVSLPSTPTPDTLTFQRFVLLSLAAAEKTIYITSPYFLPDLSLREMLIRKSKEGVDVRVLVPNDLNDSRAVRHASRDSYDQLLAGGVQIHEYQPTFIHAKSIVVDGSWSIIGSANMDNRSRKLNEEAVFGLLDKGLATKLEEVFIADTGKAEQMTLADWRKRSLWYRIQELVARNFVEQY